MFAKTCNSNILLYDQNHRFLIFLLHMISTSRWNTLNIFKSFILLSHQVDISIYIDSIHVEESTTHDLHSMDHIHHHVWFPVSKSLVQPFGLWTNLSHFRNGQQTSNDSKIKWLWKSIYMEFLYAFFPIWPKWRLHT